MEYELGFKDFKKLFPAILSGVLLVLSCTPFDLWFLAYIALVPLFLAIPEKNIKETSFFYASTGVLLAAGWFYSSISFSPLFFLLILFLLTLSFVVWGLLTKLILKKNKVPFIEVFMPAVLWTGIDRINTSEIIGLPTNLGITQAEHPIMIQSASLFGIYGVSFMIILVNTAIAYFILQKKRKAKVDIKKLYPVIIVLGLFVMNIAFGYMRVHSEQTSSPSIKVGTVQPVISSDMYANGWRNPENRKFMKATFDRLTAKAVSTGAKMIFWPEGGNGYMNMRIPELRENIYRIAQENDLDFIVSTNDIDGEGRKFNSIFSISRQGNLLGRYDKVRLVPIAESEYTAGKSFHTIPSSLGQIGPAVCFESCFPSILRKVTSQGAEILLVSTSDAVFSRSTIALSHANTSVFRAVENGRWLIHAANTGPSLIVSPTGKIVQQTKFYDRNIMVGEVAPRKKLTFFTRFGYLIPESFSLFVLLFASYRLFLAWKERPQKSAATKKKKTKKQQKIKPVPFDTRRLLGQCKSGFILFAVHLMLILLLIPISLYFVKITTDSELSYAQTFIDFMTPAGQLQAEKVTEKFLQAKSNTCGPAVLAYLLSFLGKETLEDELVEQVHLEERGTSMLELKMAVQRLGFDASGVQENYTALLKEVLPVIAYINDNHYVVVNKVYSNYLHLFDPAVGHIIVSRSTFERIWNGYLLLVRVKSIQDSLTVNNYSSSKEINKS